jgi:hypothetical protein
LADEVFDCGGYLLVRKGSIETQVPFKSIQNVSFSFTNPPRITLLVSEPTPLGKSIVFSPIRRFSLTTVLNPFKNEIADELIERAGRARQS